MKHSENPKICLVTSAGGHFFQMYNLNSWWSKYPHFWVTFDKPDTRSLLETERVYEAYSPTNRNLKNLARNLCLAWKILLRERPDLIVSAGAGLAVPFFYIGKLLGARLIFIETFARVDSPTLTGRLVYPVVDKFLVQWPEQFTFYPKGEHWGTTL